MTGTLETRAARRAPPESISDENTLACSVDRTRPPRRYIAASKEKRVRVDGS